MFLNYKDCNANLHVMVPITQRNIVHTFLINVYTSKYFSNNLIIICSYENNRRYITIFLFYKIHCVLDFGTIISKTVLSIV